MKESILWNSNSQTSFLIFTGQKTLPGRLLGFDSANEYRYR